MQNKYKMCTCCPNLTEQTLGGKQLKTKFCVLKILHPTSEHKRNASWQEPGWTETIRTQRLKKAESEKFYDSLGSDRMFHDPLVTANTET